jgi:hypothetical protein
MISEADSKTSILQRMIPLLGKKSHACLNLMRMDIVTIMLCLVVDQVAQVKPSMSPSSNSLLLNIHGIVLFIKLVLQVTL